MAHSKTFQRFENLYNSDIITDEHLDALCNNPDAVFKATLRKKQSVIGILPPAVDNDGGPLRVLYLMVSDGLLTYCVENRFHTRVSSGDKQIHVSQPDKINYVTSLRKLGWSGEDQAVVMHGYHKHDIYDDENFGKKFYCIRHGTDEVFVYPEKVCLMPSANGKPNLIYALRDSKGRTSLYSSARPSGKFYAKCDVLTDYWICDGNLWFIEKEEPDHQILRIIDPNWQLVKRIETNSHASHRPISLGEYLYWPIKKDNGKYEFKMFVRDTSPLVVMDNIDDMTEVFICGDNELWLLNKAAAGTWQPMRSIAEFGPAFKGKLLGRPSIWDNELLWAMQDDEKNMQFVVYGNTATTRHDRVDPELLRVHKGKPVYAATCGSDCWAVFYDDKMQSKKCDRVLEIDVSGAEIVVYYVKSRKVIREELDV